MVNLFKVLSIVVAVAAVTLMAVALATYWVKPDLRSEMNTIPMSRYTFEQSGGENPQWTVTRRFSTDPANPGDRGTISGSPFKSGYDALLAAHKDLQNYLRSQTQTLKEETETLIAQRTTTEQQQAADGEALKRRLVSLDSALKSAEDLLLEKSAALQTLSVDSRTIRDETAVRRTDVLRLRHELEEIRTDVFRLTGQRRDLTERLLRLEIEIHEVRDRSEQLAGSTP